MATQEYWSAVEERGPRRNEITCAWLLVLVAVIVLQIITSLAAKPVCQAGERNPPAGTEVKSTAPENPRVLAAVDQQPCRRL